MNYETTADELARRIAALIPWLSRRIDAFLAPDSVPEEGET